MKLDSSMPIVRNDLVKGLYGAMLLAHSRGDVGHFWAGLPLGGLTVDQTLERIWKPGGQLPLEYTLKVFGHFENWIRVQGQSPEIFSTWMRQRFLQHPVLPAKDVLLSLKPFLAHFHTSQDLRQLVLKVLDHIRLPGNQGQMIHRLVYQSVRYGWRRDVVLFSWDSPQLAATHFDYANWLLPLLLDAPTLLDLPSFEQHKILADSRPLNVVLCGIAHECEDSVVRVQGIPIGKIVPFEAYWREYGMEIDGMRLANPACVLIEKDFRDPQTQELLLRAGCLYGAPVHLVELRYPTALGKRVNPLQRLVDGLIEPEFSLWSQIRERHELLLQELGDVLEVIYYRSEDSIAIGSEHLMRSVPAKILRNILREYTATGRVQFQNREFKRDTEICMDSVNPNFEGRLNRVMERLRTRADGLLSIERNRRGGFCLHAGRPIRFREM